MDSAITFQTAIHNGDYDSPKAVSCNLEPRGVICDSYDSGIEDLEYEEIDWTVTP